MGIWSHRLTTQGNCYIAMQDIGQTLPLFSLKTDISHKDLDPNFFTSFLKKILCLLLRDRA